MRGGSSPRRKGYGFEIRTKHYLEKKGFYVVRQPRSRFPDLIALKKGELATHIENFNFVYTSVIYFIECKTNKYITSKERADLHFLQIKYGIKPLIAYKSDKGYVAFCEIDNYNEVIL